MFNFLDENIDALIKYSRYYLGFSFTLFLLIGGAGYELFSQRSVLSLFIGFSYYIFFNLPGLIMKLQKKVNKHSWEKTKKRLRRQLNFFIVFFTIGTMMFLLGSIMNFERVTFFLVAINMPLGIVLGSIKTKKTYLYDKT